MRKLLLLCALLAGSAALPVKDVAACALDQRPSMSADGRLVVVNSHAPTNPQAFATWSYFVLPGAFPARRALLLTEDRREVARTLTAEAMRQRCAWTFGDGQAAYGWQVRHTYARAGQWRIGVYVWDPEGGRWDMFDQATITTH